MQAFEYRKRLLFSTDQAGFTLIELIIVLVVVGILSSGAVVHYQDFLGHAKTGTLKSTLGATREAIVSWQMCNIVKTGSDDYPSLEVLSSPGEVVLMGIPSNPYQSADNAADSIVAGTAKGTVVGARGGWAYNPETGEFWANTNTDIQATCKNPAGKLNENTW
ncbi:MAG: prepilin-type N-terminal cleavage/methylation domain-containing protein [bacterium]|nr:prepilin-type N-terminal cleavage/methylation domain-containing protein [bacterium]